MKKYIIKLNEKVYEVEIEEVTGETAASLADNEKNTSAALIASAKAPIENNVSVGTTIEAPMPGTIIAIKVKVGDVVKKNQPLLILEAMKMENEIVSPVDGRVTSIGVSNGQSVNPGEMLVQIG
ncbi:biotin/lipoyl-containing protein [Candidatus Clostridium radicumherbarum]|uniref:Biotin/lipoyl-containing protein n=1 Tax=Candidatus Clostridium radicumherbarum TaxID=3381662 RepID=A0ABW8TTS6_9CLOT